MIDAAAIITIKSRGAIHMISRFIGLFSRVILPLLILMGYLYDWDYCSLKFVVVYILLYLAGLGFRTYAEDFHTTREGTK